MDIDVDVFLSWFTRAPIGEFGAIPIDWGRRTRRLGFLSTLRRLNQLSRNKHLQALTNKREKLVSAIFSFIHFFTLGTNINLPKHTLTMMKSSLVYPDTTSSRSSTANSYSKVFKNCVTHDYVDYAQIPVNEMDLMCNASGATTTFPLKLYDILQQADEDNEKLKKIVHWAPHGRAFVFKSKEAFVQEVMPK